ncbi:hypothetical protein AC1031_001418 [Aphanomyces cochlioides]|nr:hypothetical protein AC1031_001418 [Aphanomyces cochlioides]
MSTKKRSGKGQAAAVADAPKEEVNLRVEYDPESYLGVFQRIQQTVEKEFTNVKVTGGNYPLPPNKQKWVYFIYFIQALLGILIMFGDEIAKALKLPIDESILEKVRENKFAGVPVVLMLSPVRQLISNTGACEVYLNEVLIYSTLKTKVTLTPPKVKQLLVSKGLKPVNP